MKSQSDISEKAGIEGFLQAIRALPAARAEVMQLESAGSVGNKMHDAQVVVHIADKSYTVLIETKKAVYPRDVREVLWQLKQYRRSNAADLNEDKTVSVLIADSISPGAKELLREEQVGYYDSGGSLFFPAVGTYLFIDKPPPKSLVRAARSLFSDRRAQVLHTLLLHHENWFGVKDLAEKAKVSPATASQVLTELERFDWLSERGQGPRKERHLREPSALLDAWVNQLASTRPSALRRYFVPRAKTDELLELICKVFAGNDVEYAISYEVAAQLYAPFLSSISQVRCRLKSGAAADTAISKIGARLVTSGANLEVFEAKSAGDLLFRQQVDKVWLASPIQVYLDLSRSEGRAREMAEHLRKERIGF